MTCREIITIQPVSARTGAGSAGSAASSAAASATGGAAKSRSPAPPQPPRHPRRHANAADSRGEDPCDFRIPGREIRRLPVRGKFAQQVRICSHRTARFCGPCFADWVYAFSTPLPYPSARGVPVQLDNDDTLRYNTMWALRTLRSEGNLKH